MRVVAGLLWNKKLGFEMKPTPRMVNRRARRWAKASLSARKMRDMIAMNMIEVCEMAAQSEGGTRIRPR